LLKRYGFTATDMEMRKRGMPCILLKNLRGDARADSWVLGSGSILHAPRWDMRVIYSMHG
jgi:hypothetical protein